MNVAVLTMFRNRATKYHKAQSEISSKLNSLCMLTIRITRIMLVGGCSQQITDIISIPVLLPRQLHVKGFLVMESD
jgi:hypothetical protein